MTEHEQQKLLLRQIFPNYDARHHDAFVIAYRNWAEAHNLWAWHKDRNINRNAPEPMVRDYEPMCNTEALA